MSAATDLHSAVMRKQFRWVVEAAYRILADAFEIENRFRRRSRRTCGTAPRFSTFPYQSQTLFAYEWPLCANTGRPHNDANDPNRTLGRAANRPSLPPQVRTARSDRAILEQAPSRKEFGFGGHNSSPHSAAWPRAARAALRLTGWLSILFVALGLRARDLRLKRRVRERRDPLRMARKLDPYRETARLALEPWLVEAALARLPQTLSPADQRTIVKATRTPHKVRWPEWWSERP
jgi:hypothetical protein